MKLLTLFLLFFFTPFASFGKSLKLPRGGKIHFDFAHWDVQDLTLATGLKSFLIVHKTDKNFKGFLLDGTIKNQHVCANSDSQNKWSICEKQLKHNHQLFIERKLGKDSFQSYVLSFATSHELTKSQKSQIEQLRKFMEKN